MPAHVVERFVVVADLVRDEEGRIVGARSLYSAVGGERDAVRDR